jgi:hypothetical protein
MERLMYLNASAFPFFGDYLMSDLKSQLIRLGHTNTSLQPAISRVLHKQAASASALKSMINAALKASGLSAPRKATYEVYVYSSVKAYQDGHSSHDADISGDIMLYDQAASRVKPGHVVDAFIYTGDDDEGTYELLHTVTFEVPEKPRGAKFKKEKGILVVADSRGNSDGASQIMGDIRSAMGQGDGPLVILLADQLLEPETYRPDYHDAVMKELERAVKAGFENHKRLLAQEQDRQNKNLPFNDVLEYKMGRKYVKIMSGSEGSKGRTIVAFVNMQDGSVWKAKDRNKPSQHLWGNVLRSDYSWHFVCVRGY